MKGSGQKVVVLGAGESGVGAALLARKEGYEVWVSDGGKIKPAFAQELEAYMIPYESGQHSKDQFFDTQWVIKSPGIPPEAPILAFAREQGIPVVGEIEFASWHSSASVIAITGSNGKTTTSSLVYHLLHAAGVEVALAGNVGKSFARQLVEGDKAWFVLEVSSFQLEDILHFRPQVSALLNITPDHLDRYDYRMDRYAAAKWRITENQTPEDVIICWGADPHIRRLMDAPGTRARCLRYGLDPAPEFVAWAEGARLRTPGGTYDFAATQLLGPHNQLNTLAALLAAEAAGIGAAALKEALPGFAPIPHRLEPVGTVGGVRYINDSKATNVDAVRYALESMTDPTVWMVGGVDKGNDYRDLQALVADKVRAIVVLGAGEAKIRQSFPGLPLQVADAMETALRMAKEMAHPGDTVLLSPACASFDLFNNYEDRGNQFRQGVQAWINPSAR